MLDASRLLYEKLQELTGGDNCFHYMSAGPATDDISIAEVISQLNTISMFGAGKVVLVGPMKKPLKDGMNELAEYASSPNPDSTFIIAIMMDAKGLNQFEKSPLAKAVISNGVAVRFARMNSDEVKKWVKDQINLKGLSISDTAVERLMELGDRDLTWLGGELEKLYSYVGDEREITRKAVEEVVADHRESMVWDFTDAVAKRDFSGAVTILDSLLGNNQPLQMILKMLTGEIARLAAANGYKKRGESFEAFASGMGGPQFPLRKAWANANGWREGDFVVALRAVLKAYMDNMVAGASPRIALNTLVTGLSLKPGLQRREQC